MSKLKVFDNCVFELGKLPGVGRKTAMRLALHILKMKPDNVRLLANSIIDLKDKTRFCSECGGLSEGEKCDICLDSYRKTDIICVVEDAKDIFVIESTGQFHGVFHVLGGKISPLDGVGPDDLRIAELIERVDKNSAEEVIIATNPDVEGETTAMYISKLLRGRNVNVTKLASGIPIGSHLEYADEMTLLKAFEGRRSF